MRTDLPEPNPGDFVVTLLAGRMAALRDRLAWDGFLEAADLVADLVDITEDYLERCRQEGVGG